MKSTVVILVVAACVSVACKPRDYNTGDVQAIEGESRSPDACVKNFSADVCGKDTNAVFVTERFGVDGDLAQRTESAGFKICYGRVQAFHSPLEGGWRDAVGVWMNGGLGCWPGANYKNAKSGAKGPNVVTVLDVIDDSLVYEGRPVGFVVGGKIVSLCSGNQTESCKLKNDNNTLKLTLK